VARTAEVVRRGRKARYKPYNLKQDKLIPLSYADQIVPGSFE
jgi:hypothetical protein